MRGLLGHQTLEYVYIFHAYICSNNIYTAPMALSETGDIFRLVALAQKLIGGFWAQGLICSSWSGLASSCDAFFCADVRLYSSSALNPVGFQHLAIVQIVSIDSRFLYCKPIYYDSVYLIHGATSVYMWGKFYVFRTGFSTQTMWVNHGG